MKILLVTLSLLSHALIAVDEKRCRSYSRHVIYLQFCDCARKSRQKRDSRQARDRARYLSKGKMVLELDGLARESGE